jgi:thiol-disulfide isomerase/thioredoxin
LAGVILAAGVVGCRQHVPPTEENGGDPSQELSAVEPGLAAAEESAALPASAEESAAAGPGGDASPAVGGDAGAASSKEPEARAVEENRVQFAGMTWFTDLEAAVRKATAENKQIFMNFTGSDWCPFCILFTDQVLKDAGFQKEIQKHFVLLYADYPADESLLTPQQHRKNALLARYYAIESFPTLLLARSSGKAYVAVPYQPDSGPEVYLRQVMEANAKYAD